MTSFFTTNIVKNFPKTRRYATRRSNHFFPKKIHAAHTKFLNYIKILILLFKLHFNKDFLDIKVNYIYNNTYYFYYIILNKYNSNLTDKIHNHFDYFT